VQGTAFPSVPRQGVDFIPCLDNEAAIKKLKKRKHYEHRERHCPVKGMRRTLNCLLPPAPGVQEARALARESRDQVREQPCSV